MNRKVALPLILTALIALSSLAPGAAASGPEQTSGVQVAAGVHLISSDVQAIVFEVVAPEPTIAEMRVGEETYHQIMVQGFETLAEPGLPELPVQGVMLGVPPGVEWQVELQRTDRVVLKGPYRVLPGLSREAAPAPWSEVEAIPVQEVREPDTQTYDSPLFFPNDVAEVVGTGYLRDQRYVALRVHPVRYNPTTGEMEWYRRIRIRLTLSGEMDAGAVPGEQDGYFEPVLKSTILNYEQAKEWRSRETSLETSSAPVCGTGPQYKVIVGEEGMHELTYADLGNAGLPMASIDPRKLVMCYMGEEIAIRVLGEEDGVFNPADRVLFYGVTPYSRYTDTSTYWLTYSNTNGKRMAAKNATPNPSTPYVPTHSVVAVAEESLRYDSLFPSPKGDHWFWDDLRWLDVAPYTPRSYTIELTEIPVGVEQVDLHVGVQGYTSHKHELNVSLNGRFLGTRVWTGKEYRDLPFYTSALLLQPGTNTLTIESKDKGATPDGVWLDWFSLTYRAQNIAAEGKSLAFTGRTGPARYWLTGFADATAEAYDVSDVWNVARLSGAGAARVRAVRVPVMMQSRSTGAGAAAAEGSSSGSLTAEGYGIALEGNEASAPKYWAGTLSGLKRPLRVERDTVTNWRAPTNGADYLVITDPSLAAEATRLVTYHQEQGLQALTVYVQDIYDEFNYGNADPDAIRALLEYAYDHWAMRPSYVLLLGDGSFDFLDYYGTGEKQMVPPWLGMVDPDVGETAADHRFAAVHGGDSLPDMYVGRLPAANLAQARTMVDKVLQYPTAPATGGWDKRIVLVSDNYRDSHDVPVEVNDFIAASEAVYSGYVALPYTGTRIYFDPSPSGSGLPGRYASSAAAKAAVLSNLNQGALIWNFMGHSSYEQWALENLLHVNDVPGLTNGSRLPVLLEMTCFTGAFHLANGLSLDEELIRKASGGVVASWSPTGLGLATGHDAMQHAFYEAVFDDSVRQIGPAIAIGTVRAYTLGYMDLVDTFLLLGDPALFLR